MATSSPGVPVAFPPVPLFFHRTTEKCHTAMAWQPWSCSKLWLGSLLWLWPYQTSLLPRGRQSLAVKGFAASTVPRHRPLRRHVDGYRVLRVCRTSLTGWGRHCLVLLSCSPSSQGQCPVGTTQTVLKATGNPSLPCQNGNLSLGSLHVSWEPSLLLLYTDMVSPDIAFSCKKIPPSYCFALKDCFPGLNMLCFK